MRNRKLFLSTSASIAFLLALAQSGPVLAVDCTTGSNNTTPVIYGGTSGNDTENGCAADDQLSGQQGNDQLDGRDGADTIDGGDDNDFLFGRAGNDIVSGGGGNDGVYGGDGNDQLNGGDGDDFLRGDADADVLDGGLGNDYFHGGAGLDTYTDAGGIDRISFYDKTATQGVVASLDSAGKVTILNDGFGNAETSTNAAFEGLGSGTLFADKLTGNDGPNTFLGGKDDKLYGKKGDDRFQIDDAPEIISGGQGIDTIVIFTQFRWVASSSGGPATTAMTTNGVEVDLSLAKIIHDGWNAIPAGFGNVTGIENLGGSNGDDKLTGSGFANEIKGYSGGDIIDGRGGKDRIEGGKGVDKLKGGGNSDTFVFHAGDSPAGTPDEILDFRGGASRDVIDISDADGNMSSPLPLLTALGSTPGYMISTVSANQVRISIDVNGDAAADEEILVTFTAPVVPASNIVP